MVRCPKPRVDSRQPAGQVAAPRHREGGATDTGDQREQGAQAGDRSAEPHDRSERACADGMDGGGEGRAGPAQVGGAACCQGTDRNGDVDHDGDPERERDRPHDGALRILDLLAKRRDAGVARECEEDEARRLEHPVHRLEDSVDPVHPVDPAGVEPPAGVERVGVLGVASPHRQHHDQERSDRERHQQAGDQGCPGDAAVVQPRQADHRGNGHQPPGPGRPGHGVRRKRERHGRAGRDLADDEAPPRREPPPGSEPFPTVEVRPARGRVGRGELRGRHRVAVGDAGRDQQPEEEPRTGDAGGGSEDPEHARAHHGPEPDDDGVAGAETADQRRLVR
ncbi:MAG: hypothetical protein QOI51_986 [Nocardioidaceae bacterium]|nr:hypothetical protein [Nocardioidaceae bacterium]